MVLTSARAVVPPPRLRAFPLAFDAADASGVSRDMQRFGLATGQDIPDAD
jgi:hypothetical protein